MLTTGANSGIGLATALAVARHGYRSVGSVRSPEKAEAVARAASQAGVEVQTVLLDVTDADGCAEVIDRVRPWGLVNNAGYGMTGAIEDVDDDEARALFDTMVFAPVRLCRLALPHMRARGEGRIVNVSSLLGVTTAPLVGWYSGAKHALEALTDALRVEVASAGVRVSLVEPGGVRTEIWQDMDGDLERRRDSGFAGAYRRSALGIRLTRPFMADPGGVAEVVVRAMTTRLPRERYLVGIDALATTAATRLTPQPVRDLATRLGLGL
ncbi:MAG TPA: SDR family oxidoreductase [Acidimicrobiales bacterium]|nr:SDR family oxidoreductase [Acidimicrobiales bacterium]